MADLTTTTYVKAHLGITVTTYDTLFAQLIAGLSAFVEKYTERTFANTDYTERLDGPGHYELFLTHYPVNSVATVKRNDGQVGNPSWSTVESQYYVLYAEAGYLYRELGFVTGHQNWQVAYSAGYGDDPADMPLDLQLAMANLVGYLYKQRTQQGVKGFRTGTFAVTYQDAAVAMEQLPAVKATLESYKRRNV